MMGARLDLGIDASIASMLDAMAPPSDAPPESHDTLFARTVWARVIEPGDAVAGALIGSLGAAPALALLISGASPTELAAEAAVSGAQIDRRSIAAAVKRWVPRLDRAESVRDLERARAAGVRLVAPESGCWPVQLDDLGAHAPQLLWVIGDTAALVVPSLAVVGARACTGYGAHVTAELTDAACAAGAAIVSGAAYGVDAIAHRTALAAGARTVAVLAGGVDRAYPSAHASLLERIAQQGAVCSEMIPGAAPTRWRFLQRNRSIAALAETTLVTEAGIRSGSLNTAGHAAEIGRNLGAVPGPVTSATSAGCHRLIREYGALLVSNAEELRECIGATDAASQLIDVSRDPLSWAGNDGESPDRQPALHRRLLDALPLQGQRTEESVALAAGLAPEECRALLAELEMLGFVRRSSESGTHGPRWRLVRRE